MREYTVLIEGESGSQITYTVETETEDEALEIAYDYFVQEYPDEEVVLTSIQCWSNI